MAQQLAAAQVQAGQAARALPATAPAAKAPGPQVSSRLNSRAKVSFTATRGLPPTSVGDGNYFLAFFSSASIFLTNLAGDLSKSFLQDLQHSLISRPP